MLELFKLQLILWNHDRTAKRLMKRLEREPDTGNVSPRLQRDVEALEKSLAKWKKMYSEYVTKKILS